MTDVASVVLAVDSRQVDDGSKALDRLDTSGRRAATTADVIRRGYDNLRTSMLGLTAALGIRELIRYADTWQNLEGRIRLVTSSYRETLDVQRQLFAVAQRTRVGFEGTADLYARIARSTKEMGLEQRVLIGITETINKTLVISGASAASANAALIQLGQGFASGALRGQELMSVMEQTPRLAEAIAEGMGKTIGELRKMGEEGKLTAEAVVAALKSQADAVNREFAMMPVTIGQAFIQLSNSFMKFIGETSKSSGAGQAFVTVIQLLANHLEELLAIIGGFVAMKIAQFFLAAAAAVRTKVLAVIDYTNALALNRQQLIATAAAEAASTAAAVADATATRAVILTARESVVAKLAKANSDIVATQAVIASATATGAQTAAIRVARIATEELNAANARRSVLTAELAALGTAQAGVDARLTGAIAAQAAATAALNTAKGGAAATSGVLLRALGFLGGPIGAVTTVLGLGATAWMLWGGSASAAEGDASKAVGKSTEEMVADLNKQIEKLKERNALVGVVPSSVSKSASPQALRAEEIMAQVRRAQRGEKEYQGAFLEGEAGDVARGAVIASLMKRYNELTGALSGLTKEQQRNNDTLKESKWEQWLGKNLEFATKAEKIAAEIKKARADLGEDVWAKHGTEVEKRIRDQVNKSDMAGATKQYQQIAVARAQVELETQLDLLEESQRQIEEGYRQGEVDLTDYYDRRQQIVIERLRVEQEGIDEQIKAQQAIMRGGGSASERGSAETEIMELIARRSKVEREATATTTTLLSQRAAAERAYWQQYYQNYINAQKAEEERNDAAMDRAAELNQQFSQQRQDLEFENQMMQRERDMLIGLTKTQGDATVAQREFNIQKEVTVQLRTLNIQQQAEEARLNVNDAKYLEQMTEIQRRYNEQREALPESIRRNITLRSELDNARQAFQELRGIQVDMWQEVDRAARDTFTSIEDSGKKAFDRLRDALKNGLYSLLYSMTVRPFLINVVTSVAGADVARGAFGAAATSGGGGIGNLLSAGNSLFDAISGKGSSLVNGVSNFLGIGSTAGAAAGTFGTLSGIGALGGATGATSLLGAGIPGAFGSSVGFGGAAAGAAGGIGAAIGTALPYIGAALAIGSALGVFGGSKKSPAVGTGYTFMGDYTVGQGVSNPDYRGNYTAGSRSGYDQLTSTGVHDRLFNEAIDKAMTEFVPLTKRYGFGDNALSGLSTSFNLTTAGIGQAHDDASKPAVAIQVLSGLIAELVPGIEELAEENEELLETFIRLGEQAKIVDAIISVTGQSMDATGADALKLKDEIVELMGGMNAAAAATQAYYENFYSENERAAIELGRVRDAMIELGVSALPQTREQFRALVEAQDLNTESGREMYAGLITLASAFAEVTPTLEEAAASANEISDAVQTMADRFAEARDEMSDIINDQISMSRSAASAARDLADEYRGFALSMQDTIDALTISDLSPLTATQRMGEARGQLDTLFQQAISGDVSALDRLPGFAEQFLQMSREFNASGAAYTADFERVTSMLQQSGVASGTFAGQADYQAQLMDIQTAALEAIRDELQKPNPQVVLLERHATILEGVRDLMNASSSTLTTINSSVLDQTGQVIVGNSMIDSQTGQIIAVNQQIQGQTATLSSATLNVANSAGQLVTIQTDASGRITTVRDALGNQTSSLLAGNYTVTDPATGQVYNATVSQTGLLQGALTQQTSALTSSTLRVADPNTGQLVTIQTDAAGRISSVRDALGNQTSSLLAGNYTVTDPATGQIYNATIDQTGKVQGALNQQTIDLNAKNQQVIDATTGELTEVAGTIRDQTGKVITGNETSDAIRNLTNVSNDISEELLRSLVSNTTSQGSTFAAMVTGIDRISQLMRELVNVTNEVAAADAARIAAEQAAIEKAQRIATEQTSLSQAVASRNSLTTSINAGISGISALADKYGVTLANNAGGPAKFAVENGQLVSDYNQIIYQVGQEAAVQAFKNEFWKPGGVNDQTFGRASELSALTSQIETLRSLITSLGATPSHADGLPLVPYNNYRANLHLGETVLDADASSILRRYGINVGQGLSSRDIDELKAEMRANKEEIRALSKEVRQAIREQTRQLNEGNRVAAKEGARETANYSDAKRRR